MPLRTSLARAGLALALALAAPGARGSLGEKESSVASDRLALGAAARGSIARSSFTVHELAAGGTRVREYVSPAGLVFAVAWGGLAAPALGPLLGAYAAEYQAAASQTVRVRGRRAKRVAAADLVVERWGHMRDLHGRAYLPALVPDGVTLDDLQ